MEWIKEVISFLSSTAEGMDFYGRTSSSWRFLVSNIVLATLFISGLINLLISYLNDKKSWFCAKGTYVEDSAEIWQILIYPFWAGALLAIGYTFIILTQWVVFVFSIIIVLYWLLDYLKYYNNYNRDIKYFFKSNFSKKVKAQSSKSAYQTKLLKGLN